MPDQGDEETNREHAVRPLELEKKWLKKYNSYETVHEAIGLAGTVPEIVTSGKEGLGVRKEA